ncbi:MAG: hypothetical protein U5L96_13780 [Owenweeksia sp.]|nr:hypothetical protein [Owenweeksia sp.]
MKRNILIYLLMILLLGGVAWWLLSDKNKTTTLEDLKEEYSFSISDTSAIDKIVLANKTPSKVTLVRGEKGWLVDGQYPAREGAVNTLLETLHRMEMRNFVAER